MLLRIGSIAVLLAGFGLLSGASALAQGCLRGYNVHTYVNCDAAHFENYSNIGYRRGGRCPDGYDFTGDGCVANQPRHYRHQGYGYSSGRCPNGYDWTPSGCVPNQGRHYQHRGYGYGGGRCPNGYDWTPRGCVPNRW